MFTQYSLYSFELERAPYFIGTRIEPAIRYINGRSQARATVFTTRLHSLSC